MRISNRANCKNLNSLSPVFAITDLEVVYSVLLFVVGLKLER